MLQVMTRVFLVLLTCVSIVQVQAQKDELIGSVREVSERHFYASQNGDEIIVGSLIDSAGWRSQVIYYDVLGKKETVRFDKQGNVKLKMVEEYDAAGNNSGSRMYDAGGRLMRRTAGIFDDRGNCIQATSYGSDDRIQSRINWSFNEDGKLVETITYTADVEKPSSRTTYSYNDQGNQYEVRMYDAAGNLNVIYRYTFDEHGNQIEEKAWVGDRVVQQKHSTYDGSGLLTSEKIYDASGILTSNRMFSYTMDDQGNWIERLEYRNLKAAFISYRKITYKE